MKKLLAAMMLAAVGAVETFAQGGGPGSGPAGSPPCPDVKASQVQGASEPATGATSKKCGLGVVLFGFGGGLVGDQCPSTITYTPAHQECRGEASPETKCVPEGTVKVMARNCKCGGLIIPGLQLGITLTCECGEAYPFGTVEDAMTVVCPEERAARA